MQNLIPNFKSRTRKLVIDNQTAWDTRALRTVFLKVINENIKFEGPLLHGIKARVVYTRRGGYSGYAFYHSGRMTIRLPHPTRSRSTETRLPMLDIYHVAHLVEHELAHCRGYKHKGMCGLNGWKNAKASYYPYLDGLTIGLKAEKPKPVVDKTAVKTERIAARIKSWETKLKRAENALKKLRKQQRYYAAKAAA